MRLLTAGSLVRAQQGEKKKETSNRMSLSFSPSRRTQTAPSINSRLFSRTVRPLLVAAVNWNRSERRRWRMKRSEIRAALGKVEVASMTPKSFPLSASRTRRWFEPNRGRKRRDIQSDVSFFFSPCLFQIAASRFTSACPQD